MLFGKVENVFQTHDAHRTKIGYRIFALEEKRETMSKGKEKRNDYKKKPLDEPEIPSTSNALRPVLAML
jgi:hypothetical protein